MMYSTVDEYFTAIQKKQKELNFTWPVYNSDFMPYDGFKPGHVWSGYFTSRPNLKKEIRDFSGLTQASETLYALESLIQLWQSGNKNNVTMISMKNY